MVEGVERNCDLEGLCCGSEVGEGEGGSEERRRKRRRVELG